MNKCRYQEAKRTINFARVFAWIFIILSVGQIFVLDEESSPSYPLWERIFMIANTIIVPIIFLRTLHKLSSEIRYMSYEVFECRYSMRIVSPYFIWTGIMLAVASINDTEIIHSRAYTVYAVIVGVGIGWYYLSKYWLKKELSKAHADNVNMKCERCDTIAPHKLIDVQPIADPCSVSKLESTYRCTYCDTYTKMPLPFFSTGATGSTGATCCGGATESTGHTGATGATGETNDKK